jgi:transcription termination factor Rho
MSTVVDPAMPPENEPAQALAPLALDSIQKLPFQELIRLNEEAGLRIRTDCTRRHLVLDQARQRLHAGGRVTGTGLLERSQDFWNLRWTAYDLRPGPDDVFVPYALIKKLSLQPGVMVEAKLRLPRDREQGLVAEEILSIEGIPVAEWKPPVEFEKLNPLFPNRRVFLETPVDPEVAARAVDLLAPIGMGQRGLIAAPPRAGKTILLQTLARNIRKNHPKANEDVGGPDDPRCLREGWVKLRFSLI